MLVSRALPKGKTAHTLQVKLGRHPDDREEQEERTETIGTESRERRKERETEVRQEERTDWSRELKFLGQRNRCTPLLKASDPEDASPQLGIWSRALAKVATEPDVLFHVKPKLVGSAGDSKKRKRNEE
jgi:hypothetical protein